MTKEIRAKVITAGLENPTSDVSKAIVEVEAAGKGRYSIFLYFHQQFPKFHFSSLCNYFFHIFNTSCVFLDAEKEPADNLTKLAAVDVDDLLSKTRDINKGVLSNMWQSLLKEWWPDSLGVLLEDINQELLTGVTF